MQPVISKTSVMHNIIFFIISTQKLTLLLSLYCSAETKLIASIAGNYFEID